MKPILLNMTAFGSYAEPTEIDFRQFHDGLFLITGDTGAGKTTIFDGIVFALFGTSSGSERRPEIMHCDYVSKAQDTVVTLTFEQSGKEYRVERKLHFPKKRGGEEYDKGKVSAVLYEPTDDAGGIVQGAAKVNERIEEILGLNREQFCQIVMLAQGEFDQFLKADSEDKNEILGRLFDHSIYQRYAELINQACVRLREERRECTDQIRAYMEQTFLAPDSAGEEYLPDSPRLLESLEDLIDRESEQIRLAEEKKKEQKRELDQLHTELGAAETRNQLLEELRAKEARLQELLAKAPEMDALREQMAQAAQIHREIRPAEKNRAEAKARWKALGENVAQLKEQQKAQEETLAAAEAELGKDAAAQDRIEQIAGEIRSLEDARPLCEKLQQAAEEIETGRKELSRRRTSLEKSEQEQLRFAEEALRLKDRYDDMYRRFIEGQAGILAEDLREQLRTSGEANCPVCGTVLGASQEGQLAQLAQETPDRASVEKARTAFAQAEENRDKQHQQKERLAAEIEKETAILDAREKELQTQRSALPYESTEEIGRQIEVREEEKTKLQQQMQMRRQQADAARKAVDTTKGALHTEMEKLPAAQTQADDCEAALAKILQQTGFDSVDAAKRRITEITGADGAQDPERWLQQAGERQQSFTVEQQSTEQRVRELKQQTEGWAWQDLSQIRDRISDGNAKYADTEKAVREQSNLRDNHRQVLDGVKAAQQKRMASDKAWQILQKLSMLASGASSEGGKLSFDRYVMGATFREIIEQASGRLEILSGGRYQMIHQTRGYRKNSRAGLDIEVLDHNTGIQRESRSLSGGESFIVSMALALGLSDVVRNHAGGQALDTLFIDEGFGSLDHGRLEDTMNVLNTLTGDDHHLVGIISHVSELEECIPQKITVRNGSRGSRIESGMESVL